MTKLMTDKEFNHAMCVKYYNDESKQKERDKCIRCGEMRVLGQRGEGKAKCNKCKKESVK